MSVQVGYASAAVFPTFHDALDSIHEMSKDQRMVMVIDEYPYLARAYPGFSSLCKGRLITASITAG
jgi:hypothetical protein